MTFNPSPTAAPTQLQIRILLFAGLQARAGVAETGWLLDADAVTDCQDLYVQVAAKYQLPSRSPMLRVALNHQFVPWTQPVQAGDVVAFIPPVSGG